MLILFVCTGNTCRSPMAEVIFNKLCTIDNIKAISAGVSAVKGSIITENAATMLNNNFKADFNKREAVQLTKVLLQEADLVLTMTRGIKSTIIPYLENTEKIFTLNEYVGMSGDIIDPYGGDIDIYSETFSMLKDRIMLLLDKLKG